MVLNGTSYARYLHCVLQVEFHGTSAEAVPLRLFQGTKCLSVFVDVLILEVLLQVEQFDIWDD